MGVGWSVGWVVGIITGAGVGRDVVCGAVSDIDSEVESDYDEGVELVFKHEFDSENGSCVNKSERNGSDVKIDGRVG